MSVNDEDESYKVVIELGSGMMKAGFGGDDAPRCVFPTRVQSPKYSKFKQYYVGDEIQFRRRNALNTIYPIKRGNVVDKTCMVAILHHTFFNELRVEPQLQQVLLGTNYFMTKKEKKDFSEYFFETLQIKSIFYENREKLALFGTGRITGVVLASGHETTRFVPISEHNVDLKATRKIDFGGKDLTQIQTKLLSLKGYNFYSSYDNEIIRDMKEKQGFVALNYSEEMVKSYKIENQLYVHDRKHNYEMPDGSLIHMGRIQARVPEALFEPNRFGFKFPGVHKILYESILSSHKDIRRELANNIVLSGGSTLFKGFEKRLNKELNIISQNSMKLKIIAKPERKYLTWIGGSIFSSLEYFNIHSTTKEYYLENGYVP